MSALWWLVLTRSAADNSTRLVAVTLALLADRDGAGDVPTATLLRLTRCSERTLRQALRDLVRLGEFEAVTADGRTAYRWLLSAESAGGGNGVVGAADSADSGGAE